VIRIRGLRKTYGELVAVAGLDLDAAEGEILALLGPNGAGKSTTVKCLVGLLRPDAGELSVAGHDALREPARARRALCYVPEIARVHDALTPVEYLQLKGRLFELTDPEIDARTGRLLAGFGLADRGDQAMAGFSKGMAQKVSLAAALLPAPRALVLDEPLSGLDVETTMVVKEVLREFAARGGTVLYCSHLLDVVETLAHRVAVIDRGRLQAVGTMDELRARSGAGADARLEGLFRTLTRAGDPRVRAREILGSD
jgi:ABC-2 type transport system ATP-binding protein